MTAAGYRYKGKAIDLTGRVAEIAGRLPSVEAVVMVPAGHGGQGGQRAGGTPGQDRGGPDPSAAGVPGAMPWEDFLLAGGAAARDADALRIPDYTRLPFDHPLAILYSSGTTGLPKCIVHTAGGTLLQHQKEQ